jgi:predicted dehydrogenase
MKTIRWGMIGCGDVTEKKSGPGFAKATNSELAAVMRRNGALPRFLAVRDLVANDAIGEIRTVISRHFQRPPSADHFADGAVPWRVNPELSGGGFFFEGACHTFDFLDFMFGPIVEVRAFAGNQAGAYRPEDIVSATYRFASGVFGSGTWCYMADFDEEHNEIVGDRGRIRFSTTQPVPIRIYRGESVEELRADDPDHVQQPLIQSIVDELNGSGKCPSSGDSAARTARVMESILADFRAQARGPATARAKNA